MKLKLAHHLINDTLLLSVAPRAGDLYNYKLI